MVSETNRNSTLKIDRTIVENELRDYMLKLKELCDEAMISYCIQNDLAEGLQKAIIEKQGDKIIVDRQLYKSCIKEIVYSPNSDTFFLYINAKEKGIELLKRLQHQFIGAKLDVATDNIDYEIINNIIVLEIIYNQDSFYHTHIKKNIKEIVSLNLSSKNAQ